MARAALPAEGSFTTGQPRRRKRCGTSPCPRPQWKPGQCSSTVDSQPERLLRDTPTRMSSA